MAGWNGLQEVRKMTKQQKEMLRITISRTKTYRERLLQDVEMGKEVADSINQPLGQDVADKFYAAVNSLQGAVDLLEAYEG